MTLHPISQEPRLAQTRLEKLSKWTNWGSFAVEGFSLEAESTFEPGALEVRRLGSPRDGKMTRSTLNYPCSFPHHWPKLLALAQ